MLAKVCTAVIAAAIVLTSTPAWTGDDDDDHDREKQRHRRHGKHAAREVHHHHHYYFLPPGTVIGRYGARPTPTLPDRALTAPESGPGSPGGFPKESLAERASAKERQRDILEKELAVEEELLAQARRRSLPDNAELHERNIAALRRELDQVNR